MATGKVHAQKTRGNLKIIAVGSIALLIYSHHAPVIGLTIGAVIGHYLTPDYDLNHVQYTQRLLIRKCWLLGWIWRIYWYPYSILCTHRGSSHSWPLGTLIRLLYMLAPLAVLALIYIPIITGVSIWLLFIFVGQSLQDFSHLRLDNRMPYAIFARKPIGRARKGLKGQLV